MPETGSIHHLFELAIQAEHLAESFYQQLAFRFSRNPDIEHFWIVYAVEETNHAHWLEILRARLSPEQLAAPADPTALELATRAVSVSLEDLLARVKTLQDAYNLANELEHEEINAVFEFLICHFAEDQEAMTYMRSELDKHVRHLIIDFPRQHGTGTLRRGILVNDC